MTAGIKLGWAFSEFDRSTSFSGYEPNARHLYWIDNGIPYRGMGRLSSDRLSRSLHLQMAPRAEVRAVVLEKTPNEAKSKF